MLLHYKGMLIVRMDRTNTWALYLNGGYIHGEKLSQVKRLVDGFKGGSV